MPECNFKIGIYIYEASPQEPQWKIMEKNLTASQLQGGKLRLCSMPAYTK